MHSPAQAFSHAPDQARKPSIPCRSEERLCEDCRGASFGNCPISEGPSVCRESQTKSFSHTHRDLPSGRTRGWHPHRPLRHTPRPPSVAHHEVTCGSPLRRPLLCLSHNKWSPPPSSSTHTLRPAFQTHSLDTAHSRLGKSWGEGRGRRGGSTVDCHRRCRRL